MSGEEVRLQPKKVEANGTACTVYPFHSLEEVPLGLRQLLHETFNAELAKGNTYPQEGPMDYEDFVNYWLHYFAAVMLKGDPVDVQKEGLQFESLFMGSFYIKPNYPGRSSHNCNAGFLVNPERRGMRVGRTMGETYLEWAPQLGYTYSVFNLVYETNVASCRIWDGLGFERIGRIKNAGRLEGHDKPVDAIMYGKDLV